MKNQKRPMSISGAYVDGCMHADAWLNRVEKPLPPLLMECAAWRAHGYAETVKRYETRPEFLPLLAEWERGFDETVRTSDQYYAAAGNGSSVPDKLNIERLIAQANALSALLAVADALPTESRQSVLMACLTIANEAAGALAALAGGKSHE